MQKSSIYDVIQSHKVNPPQGKPSTKTKRKKTYWHPRSPSCCAFAVTLSYSHHNWTRRWLFYKGSHAMLPSVLASSQKNCTQEHVYVKYSIWQMYHNVLESTLVKNISFIFGLDYVQATFLVVMTKHLTRGNLWKAWEGVCCGSQFKGTVHHGKEHGGMSTSGQIR